MLTCGCTLHSDDAITFQRYNAAKRGIFFAASKETALETHWYSQSLDHSYACVGDPVLLTEKGFTHNVKISQSGRYVTAPREGRSTGGCSTRAAPQGLHSTRVAPRGSLHAGRSRGSVFVVFYC